MRRRGDNVVQYVERYADSDFWRLPFGVVDGLVLSSLCYADLELTPFGKIDNFNCTISELGQLVNAGDISRLMWNKVRGEQLLSVVADSRRFGNILMHHYRHSLDEARQQQFTAITYAVNTDIGRVDVVTFQGTDDTLTGWKEDFNMMFERHLPAQRLAVKYLEEVASLSDNKLVVTGHSKGGNLAVYAAMKCSRWAKKRIIHVYDYDGPGFLPGTFSALEKVGVAGKVIKVIPENAFFGLLLDGDSYRRLIVQSDGRSIFQHDPLTWLIDEAGNLKLAKDISLSSKLTIRTIRRWLMNLSMEQRREFVEGLYRAIAKTRQTTVPGLKHYLATHFSEVVKNIRDGDPAVRQAIVDTLKLFIRSSIAETASSIRQALRRR